jgi:hypothetical protein
MRTGERKTSSRRKWNKKYETQDRLKRNNIAKQENQKKQIIRQKYQTNGHYHEEKCF